MVQCNCMLGPVSDKLCGLSPSLWSLTIANQRNSIAYSGVLVWGWDFVSPKQKNDFFYADCCCCCLFLFLNFFAYLSVAFNNNKIPFPCSYLFASFFLLFFLIPALSSSILFSASCCLFLFQVFVFQLLLFLSLFLLTCFFSIEHRFFSSCWCFPSLFLPGSALVCTWLFAFAFWMSFFFPLSSVTCFCGRFCFLLHPICCVSPHLPCSTHIRTEVLPHHEFAHLCYISSFSEGECMCYVFICILCD